MTISCKSSVHLLVSVHMKDGQFKKCPGFHGYYGPRSLLKYKEFDEFALHRKAKEINSAIFITLAHCHSVFVSDFSVAVAAEA